MKFYDLSLVIIGVIIVSVCIGYVSSRYLGQDNPVEETAEVVIQQHTGVPIDLTPDTPEKKIDPKIID